MTKAAKNVISHRGRALGQLRTWLLDHADTFAAEVDGAKRSKTAEAGE